MNIFYSAYKTVDIEIGWIVSDDGLIYLGSPYLGNFIDLPMRLSTPRDDGDPGYCYLTTYRDDDRENPALFCAVEYTKEIDDRIKSLIDGLISLRLSHPHLVQLELELLEEPANE